MRYRRYGLRHGEKPLSFSNYEIVLCFGSLGSLRRRQCCVPLPPASSPGFWTDGGRGGEEGENHLED